LKVGELLCDFFIWPFLEDTAFLEHIVPYLVSLVFYSKQKFARFWVDYQRCRIVNMTHTKSQKDCSMSSTKRNTIISQMMCSLLARVNQHPPVHQCGWMVHWWVHLFRPSLSLANQGGELTLTFFSFPQPRLVFLGISFFSPPTPAQASPSYLHLDYLPMHLGLLPPPPTYLHAHLPTHLFTYPPICLPTHPKSNYLCTYALNLL
jgi:hypothetical protein